MNIPKGVRRQYVTEPTRREQHFATEIATIAVTIGIRAASYVIKRAKAVRAVMGAAAVMQSIPNADQRELHRVSCIERWFTDRIAYVGSGGIEQSMRKRTLAYVRGSETQESGSYAA
jgi:hypothetical protein